MKLMGPMSVQRKVLLGFGLGSVALFLLLWTQSLKIAIFLFNLTPPTLDGDGRKVLGPGLGAQRKILDWIYRYPADDWVPLVIQSQDPLDSSWILHHGGFFSSSYLTNRALSDELVESLIFLTNSSQGPRKSIALNLLTSSPLSSEASIRKVIALLDLTVAADDDISNFSQYRYFLANVSERCFRDDDYRVYERWVMERCFDPRPWIAAPFLSAIATNRIHSETIMNELLSDKPWPENALVRQSRLAVLLSLIFTDDERYYRQDLIERRFLSESDCRLAEWTNPEISDLQHFFEQIVYSESAAQYIEDRMALRLTRANNKGELQALITGIAKNRKRSRYANSRAFYRRALVESHFRTNEHWFLPPANLSSIHQQEDVFYELVIATVRELQYSEDLIKDERIIFDPQIRRAWK